MRPCGRKHCPNEGEWQVVLLLRHVNTKEPIRAHFDLWICNSHKAFATVDDFLSDQGWLQILQSFEQNNLYAPKRELTSLDFTKNDLFLKIRKPN